MFLYAYIFIVIGASCAVAQTADSAHAKPDSIGKYVGPTVIVERTRELTLIAPLVAQADLREVERIAASSSLSQVLPLLHSSFDVRSYGTLGGISLPSFRGLPPEYIAVYRNGIRLTNAQNSLTDLERYTSRATSKVNILSSTESAMYASGVAGAAVVIEDNPVAGSGQYAGGVSFETYDDVRSLNDKEYFVRCAQPLGPSSVKFSANYRSTDGAFPFYQKAVHSFVDRENNDAYLAVAELAPVLALSEGERLSALLTFSEAERGVPGPNTIDLEGASTPYKRQYDNDRLAGIFYAANTSEKYHHEASLSYQSQYETYSDRGAITDFYRNTIFSAAYQSRLQTEYSLVLFGTLGFDRDMLASNRHQASSAIARNRYSGSLAAKYAATEELSISALLRIEQASDVGSLQFLPALSASFQISDKLTVSGSISRFFHPPTFNQLYWAVGGNSSLVPEHGISYELRSSYALRLSEETSVTLQGALFLTDISDQIIWTPGSDNIWYPVQMQRVRTQGVEFDSHFDHEFSEAHHFKLRLAATYLDKVNLVESSLYYGKQLPYSAPLRFNAIADYDWKPVGSLAAVYWYRAGRYSDFANNAGAQLPAVATFDLHLRSAPVAISGVGITPQLSVINASNEQYEDVLGYPLPGRIFKLSFDFTNITN